MIFETHSHYDDKRFDLDREQVIESLKNEVDYIINVGCDIETSKNSILLSEKYDNIFASVGFHPHNAKDCDDKALDIIENLAKNEKVVAIGEIGLDYHYDFSDRDVQKDVFKKQLELSKKLNKPVIIHSREACQDVFDIIKKSNVNKGVIHAFSGSLEIAKEYVKLGFFLGIGGVLTFKNAKKLVDVVKEISINNILIETDTPYLAPEPVRGTRNDSHNLKHVINKIAEIKQISKDEVEKITFNNAKKLFL